MATTNQKTSEKLDHIMAKAQQNRRDSRRFDLTSLTPEAEGRLAGENITEAQMKLLDKLGVVYDSRPISEGGSTSRWNAMQLIDEALRDAKERRERARAEPASEKQLVALLKFGCNAGDIENLNAGEASDLIRRFAAEIAARQNVQSGTSR